MREIQIPLPTGVDCESVERMIGEAIQEAGLQITLHGTLKKHPGCIHWHLKHGGAAGTLEITLWPAQRRAWFSVQDRRTAAWIDEAVVRLDRLLRRKLSGA